jgi:hypothetical protein
MISLNTIGTATLVSLAASRQASANTTRPLPLPEVGQQRLDRLPVVAGFQVRPGQGHGRWGAAHHAVILAAAAGRHCLGRGGVFIDKSPCRQRRLLRTFLAGGSEREEPRRRTSCLSNSNRLRTDCCLRFEAVISANAGIQMRLSRNTGFRVPLRGRGMTGHVRDETLNAASGIVRSSGRFPAGQAKGRQKVGAGGTANGIPQAPTIFQPIGK